MGCVLFEYRHSHLPPTLSHSAFRSWPRALGSTKQSSLITPLQDRFPFYFPTLIILPPLFTPLSLFFYFPPSSRSFPSFPCFPLLFLSFFFLATPPYPPLCISQLIDRALLTLSHPSLDSTPPKQFRPSISPSECAPSQDETAKRTRTTLPSSRIKYENKEE